MTLFSLVDKFTHELYQTPCTCQLVGRSLCSIELGTAQLQLVVTFLNISNPIHIFESSPKWHAVRNMFFVSGGFFLAQFTIRYK